MSRPHLDRRWLIALLIALILLVIVYSPTFRKAPETVTTKATYASTLSVAKYALVWPTYNRDSSRAGYDPNEPTTSNVALAWRSVPLDSYVYAQPLIVGDRVIVPTENDSVYALDVNTGRVIWRTNLGAPVPLSTLPCGNIDPSGITSTPVIDAGARTVYVVAFLVPYHHELYALDLDNGAIRFHRGVDPQGASPRVHQQRGALALSKGLVYVPYGGLLGDCGDYHGWIVAAPVNNTESLLSYMVPTTREGGIWAPSGPAIDGDGSIFVATGNGESTSTFDYGNGVIRLSPNLKPLDWFAASDWADLNAGDVDLGSVGPLILNSTFIFQIGKSGVGYLLNAGHLGGVGGQLFAANVCQSAYGGAAYAPPYIYVPCSNGLTALRLKPGAGISFSVAWRGPTFFAGPPIVAGGAVWTTSRNDGELYAFNATSGKAISRQQLGFVVHFATLSAGYGRVFVSAGKQIVSFALTQTVPYISGIISERMLQATSTIPAPSKRILFTREHSILESWYVCGLATSRRLAHRILAGLGSILFL